MISIFFLAGIKELGHSQPCLWYRTVMWLHVPYICLWGTYREPSWNLFYLCNPTVFIGPGFSLIYVGITEQLVNSENLCWWLNRQYIGHLVRGFTHWKWWFSIVMLVYQRVDFFELLDTETHSLTTGWTLEWRLRTPWRPRNHQQEIRAWGDELMATTN